VTHVHGYDQKTWSSFRLTRVVLFLFRGAVITEGVFRRELGVLGGTTASHFFLPWERWIFFVSFEVYTGVLFFKSLANY